MTSETQRRRWSDGGFIRIVLALVALLWSCAVAWAAWTEGRITGLEKETNENNVKSAVIETRLGTIDKKLDRIETKIDQRNGR